MRRLGHQPHPKEAGVDYAGSQQRDSVAKRLARRIEPGSGWRSIPASVGAVLVLRFQARLHLTYRQNLALCSHARSHSQRRTDGCLQLNSTKASCAADGSRALRGPPLESIPVPRHQGLARVPQIASPNRPRCRRCSITSDCLLSTKRAIAKTATPTCTTSRPPSRCTLFPRRAMCLH